MPLGSATIPFQIHFSILYLHCQLVQAASCYAPLSPLPLLSWVQKIPSEPVFKHPQFVFFCSSPQVTAKNLKIFCLVPQIMKLPLINF